MFDKNKKTLLIAAVAGAVILITDIFTPAGFIPWILLIPVLAFTARPLTGRQVGWVAAAFVAVICLGYILSLSKINPAIGLANRALGAAAVAVLAYRIIMHKRADAALREMGIDIAERKRTEEALRESEERLRTLADNIAQFAWMADGKGRVFWYNKRWFDYTGTTLEEMEGWGWQKVHHPDHVRRVVEKIEHCFRTGEYWEDTFPLRGRDGQYRWFLSRAVPIRDEDGRVVRWLGTNTDITEQIELERARTDFVSMLTHDLKSPLTTIMGYSELLGRICVREGSEAGEMLEAIQRSSERMMRMVEDFLLVSRLEAGKMQLTPVPEDIAAVLGRTVMDFAPAAEKKGVRLEKELGPLPPACVDRKYLERSVGNLIQNAVNHTPPGGTVTLKAESGTREGGRRSGDYLAVTVEDTGPGIPEEDRGRVFDRYFTASREGGMKGTGLGLAIVKAVAEGHGGRAAVDSEPGRGSAFHIYLPLRTIC